MKIISFFLALFQVAGVTLGVIPVNTDVDYGGTYRPTQYTTNMIPFIVEGQSDYVIVIDEDAGPGVQTAADGLQKYLAKISGVTLPVVTDTAAPADEEILVGVTNRNVYSGVDFEKLGEEGFHLKASDKKLVIAANGERGAVYGVYAFLEEQLGCRWYSKTCEYVPSLTMVSFSGDMDDCQVPDFSVRRVNYSWVTSEESNVSFLYKSRTNVTFYQNYTEFGGGLDYVLWDVTLDRLVPDSLYDTDPTFFAYREKTGERTRDHVCLTNPDVLEIAVKNAEKYIDENTTGAQHIHIGQKDNQEYCQCDTCKAMYEKYGSVSGPTVVFANRFQEALARDGYDIDVTFYAYGETSLPPEDDSLKCNPKVIPVVCGTIDHCHSHPFTECGYIDNADINNIFYRYSDHSDTKFSDELEGWTSRAERVYIYDYSINFINDQIFLSNLKTLGENTRFFRDCGVTGYTYTCGSDRITPFCDLRNYLYSKVMWNADSDVEYYIDDFLQGYYGNAAPMVKEYLDYITAKTSYVHVTNTDWADQSTVYTFDAFRLEKIWKKALAQELTPEERYRTEMLEISWRYTEAVCLAGRFNLLNPLRAKEQKRLYDDLLSHNIVKLSSMSGGLIPSKDKINFVFSTPQDWR